MTSGPVARCPSAGTARVVVVVAAIAAAAIVAAALWAALRPNAARGPNVLVLVMDTTRADRCSINGYARPTTPRLDAFARDATLFRDAWSPANWTGPAHASLFTGLRLEQHGFYEGNRRYLAAGTETIASRLAAAGWATACWSNNTSVSAEFGLTQGFEKIARPYERPDRSYPWAPATHAAAGDWALAQAAADKPFFLFINDMEPHLPYEPPADVAARFLREPIPPDEMAILQRIRFPDNVTYDLGVDIISPRQMAQLSDLYDGEIATLDAAVGDLLDRLAAADVLDDTLVVVTSDHGENLGDHHLFEHAIGLHRTLLHVPLVVRFPGGTGRGRVVDDVVRLEDIAPTVLEACGLPLPPDLDGAPLTRDLAGRIARAMQPPQPREMIRYVNICGPTDTSKIDRGIESAYDGRFHFLRHTDGTEELFDVRADPGETQNLRDSAPADADRMRALLPPRVPALAAADPSGPR